MCLAWLSCEAPSNPVLPNIVRALMFPSDVRALMTSRMFQVFLPHCEQLMKVTHTHTHAQACLIPPAPTPLPPPISLNHPPPPPTYSVLLPFDLFLLLLSDVLFFCPSTDAAGTPSWIRGLNLLQQPTATRLGDSLIITLKRATNKGMAFVAHYVPVCVFAMAVVLCF